MPDQYYFGADSFTYTVLANGRESAPATVGLHVTAGQDIPVAGNLTLARLQTKSVSCPLPIMDHHRHALHCRIVSPPKHGTLSATDTAEIIYTPTTVANVADAFTYIATDGITDSKPATVTLEAKYPCPKRTLPITIDGDVSEWPSLPYDMKSGMPLTDEKKQTWKGPQDCDYRFGVCYDEKYVYIGIRVIDDKVCSDKRKAPWFQDGIELRIDGRPKDVRCAGNGANEMDDFILLATCPMPNATASNVYTPEKLPHGCRYACVTNKTGYAAEVAIPVAYFQEKGGKHWDGFRLNCIIDDFDGDTAHMQYYWKPDWRSLGAKSYEGSGDFLLQ